MNKYKYFPQGYKREENQAKAPGLKEARLQGSGGRARRGFRNSSETNRTASEVGNPQEAQAAPRRPNPSTRQRKVNQSKQEALPHIHQLGKERMEGRREGGREQQNKL